MTPITDATAGTKPVLAQLPTPIAVYQRLGNFLGTALYSDSVAAIRALLRRHLVAKFGGNWEVIHYQYGMYNISCRVKSTPRILEKFNRLVREGHPLDDRNFHKYIPDLVAGRLVIVDPNDLFQVAELVRTRCGPPIFNDPDAPFLRNRVRHGHLSSYHIEKFQAAGYEVSKEPTGYGSVHFVFRLGEQFFKEKCYDEEVQGLYDLAESIKVDEWHVEVQVRTMLDDAWGEIDHFVRYEDPSLREDHDIAQHFSVLSSYIQAANHHVAVIRELARRKKKELNNATIAHGK